MIWQALHLAGALLLGHKLKGATATYGLFALVLGLLAWIYLGAITTVICAEYNAVRARQLWPRCLLTPFTDNMDLTPADQRAYTSYARTERPPVRPAATPPAVRPVPHARALGGPCLPLLSG